MGTIATLNAVFSGEGHGPVVQKSFLGGGFALPVSRQFVGIGVMGGRGRASRAPPPQHTRLRLEKIGLQPRHGRSHGGGGGRGRVLVVRTVRRLRQNILKFENF